MSNDEAEKRRANPLAVSATREWKGVLVSVIRGEAMGPSAALREVENAIFFRAADRFGIYCVFADLSVHACLPPNDTLGCLYGVILLIT